MKQASIASRSIRREGVRSFLVVLLIMAAARAFLVPAAPQREHAFKIATSTTSSWMQPPAAAPGRTTTCWRNTKRRTPSSSCYCSRSREGFSEKRELAGASGLSATPSVGDATTRAEALTGFFAAVVSAATVLAADAPGANSDGLGVVDDLLADCPSVRLTSSVNVGSLLFSAVLARISADVLRIESANRTGLRCKRRDRESESLGGSRSPDHRMHSAICAMVVGSWTLP